MKIEEIIKRCVELEMVHANNCPAYNKGEMTGCNCYVQMTLNNLLEIEEALEKSVVLQSHYADLLNMHDGGERIIFKSVEEWMNRLKKLRSESSDS